MRQLIQVGVLGAALAFSLVGTYLVYFDDSEGVVADSDGVAVYVATPEQLKKVTFEAEDEKIVIGRMNDGSDYLMVSVTKTREVMPPPPEPVSDSDGTDDTDNLAAPPEPPEPELVESTERFVGNDQAEELWADFGPFRADRSLEGNPSDIEFGFDAPYATLSVDRTTGPVEVVFGAPTYGERARYVKSGEKIFLVKKRDITRIQSTEKLMERDLHPYEPAGVDRIVVKTATATRTLVHKNPDDRVKAYWADAGSEDTRDDVVSGWLPTLLGLRARGYVDEAPADLTEVLTATLTGDQGDATITVLSDGAESPTWYARTSHNRGTVELTPSQAEELTADLEAVMSPQAPE